MSKKYPSDMSMEQFKKIEDVLLGARKIIKPRTLALYEIFYVVLYLLKTGC